MSKEQKISPEVAAYYRAQTEKFLEACDKAGNESLIFEELTKHPHNAWKYSPTIVAKWRHQQETKNAN